MVASYCKTLFCFCVAVLCLILLVPGCSEVDKPPASAAITKDTAQVDAAAEPAKLLDYKDTGDIDALRQRGVIRLLAPKFDTEQQLPRNAVPAEEYQALAERFVQSLDLQPKWIFVDSYTQLLEYLNDGKGDLIATNLSVTAKREKHVAFSAPLASVNEVLITHENNAIEAVSDVATLTVAVPAGKAYVETLDKLQQQYPKLAIEVKQGDISDTQILQYVANTAATATVLDENIADLLLPQHPSLIKGPVLKKHREIAWAVRKNNPNLRRTLNEFLVSEHIQDSHNQHAHRDWPQIKAQKNLRILTLNNPASYFMWRGELMGFDYDLMKNFCKRHRLRLQVVVKEDIDELLKALQAGEGDVIASSLTVTDDRQAKGVVFSRRYMHIREQLISLAGMPSISEVEQLSGKRVAVNPQTAFFNRLQMLKASGIDLHIIEKPGVATESLIVGLQQRDYDFTVADSHLVAIEQSYRGDLNVNLDLSDDVDIAWGLRADQPELLQKLNAFIKKEYRGLFYNVTFNKYFADSKKIQRHKKHRITAAGQLSPYDKKIKQHADAYTFDWRLITAQMYQESKFNPNAKSFAGARGLMQVMPRTAQQFGFDNLFEPDNNIAAGLAYMDWLHDRFPGSLPLDERLFFILAAYNAGAGHVRDAQVLAKRLGKDPNRWFNNVEDAMLLLAKPKYAKRARFGYVRGSEPVNYVRSIRDRYLGYLRAVDLRG